MLSRSLRATVQVALLFLPSVLPQLVGDPVWDYCNGKGSICEAALDMSDECSEEEGASYYDCICNNGFIPTNEMCQWCKEAGSMTSFHSDNLANMCESEGHDIAPIPSSIISQQEERNATTSMPEVTYTPTYTYTYTTPTIDPWTVTLEGAGADITLPVIASEPTETDSAASPRPRGTFVWSCAIAFGVITAILW